MAGFYDDMADMVQEVLVPEDEDGLGQGFVSLKRVSTTPGAEEWGPPSEVVQTFALKASVKRVNQRFDRGTVIVETGDVVTFAALEVEPVNTDTIIVDGREKAITDLKRIPAAGTVVAWQAFIAA